MLYKLLGMAVWNGAKWYVGRRYGRGTAVKALAAGGVVAAVAGAAVVVARRAGSSS
jgi:hypothetical protein